MPWTLLCGKETDKVVEAARFCDSVGPSQEEHPPRVPFLFKKASSMTLKVTVKTHIYCETNFL